MNGQKCSICGAVFSNEQGNLPFCTNCGASLANQYYVQNYQQPRKGWSRGDKWALSAVIAIPIVFLLAGAALIGVFVVAINRVPPKPPRYYPTPYSSPGKTSNALLTFGAEGLGDGQFKNASAITVGKDGSIYVGDGTLRIQKFDSSGKFVKLWNVTESKTKTNDQYTNKITNLAIDSKNTLYVAVERNELLRYDANTGKFIGKVELYGEKWMNQAKEARVLDMFMQNDDNLAIFASSFPEGEYVMNVSPDGKAEIKHKDLLKKQSNDSMPLMGGGILVSVTGDIFLLKGVMGMGKPYLYRFKSDGSYIDRFTWDGVSSGGIWGNSFLALNSKGEIYAFSFARKQINVLNVEGVQQRTIPLNTDYSEKMILDANDNIYVLSRAKVEKFAPTGSALGSE